MRWLTANTGCGGLGSVGESIGVGSGPLGWGPWVYRVWSDINKTDEGKSIRERMRTTTRWEDVLITEHTTLRQLRTEKYFWGQLGWTWGQGWWPWAYIVAAVEKAQGGDKDQHVRGARWNETVLEAVCVLTQLGRQDKELNLLTCACADYIQDS